MTDDIYGTSIRFSFSFFAVLTLMLLTCQSSTVTVCLMSSLLHECGHLACLLIFKDKPLKIVFGAFGIRIERNSVNLLSYKKEAVVAMGGIAVNFVLSVIFFLIYEVSGDERALSGMFVNIFILLLNSIPVSMLDSGNFLRYILLAYNDEEKTVRILNRVSDICVIFITVLTVLFTFVFGFNLSLITLCVYIVFIRLFAEK